MNRSGTEGQWEKRWHPLREEWVVYSAHRNDRPWQGSARTEHTRAPAYDPDCYLCPGNTRISGAVNPKYTDVFIFNNDHPVVGSEAPDVQSGRELYRKERAEGVAKVVCYDPRHAISLAQMNLEEVQRVFLAFQQETQELAANPTIRNVLIFENKGEVVGVSNPHPHCQIYATDFIFKNVEQHLRVADQYRSRNARNIFSDIIAQEERDGIRIIAQNAHAIAFIPFFARYAYEVMVFPRNRHATLVTMSEEELRGFAAVFHEVVRRLDMNFNLNFPYVMSCMQAPVDGKQYDDFHMYCWLQPPYRQPGLIKYLAGPEIGAGNFMADTMPEEKAAELRHLDVNTYVASQA